MTPAQRYLDAVKGFPTPGERQAFEAKGKERSQAPPAQLKAVLPAFEHQLVEEVLRNGWVVVKFPESYKSLELTVGKVDEHWRRMEFPSNR